MKERQKILDEILLPSFLTAEQKDAITSQGGRLLVNASAGSGKTFVLSSRVVYSITREENPARIDHILVVTFTKAAAKEMKTRITSLLKKVSSQLWNDPKIAQQLLLLGQAKIMTIDAFCVDFLRNHFDLIDFSPNFRIVDQHEMEQLWNEVLEELFERDYQKEPEAFQELVDYFDLKGDAALKKSVLALYNAMRKEPFPLDWLSRGLNNYRTPSIYLEELYGYLSESFKSIRAYYLNGQEDAAKYPRLKKHLAEYYRSALVQLDEIVKAARQKDWDGCKELAEQLSFGRKPSSRSLDEVCKEALSRQEAVYLKPARERFKKIREEVLFCSEEEFLKDLSAQLPYLRKLVDLTEEFYRESSRQMRIKNSMDFMEIEQLTLSLLLKRTKQGGYDKTALGKELSTELDELFVDEFQDVNPLQDLLFSALSQDEKNLFLVGDRKQSIYRFRQADPSLFVKKQTESVRYGAGSYPAFINLAENFRSRREVIDTVNAFFSKMMRTSSEKFSYGKEEALQPGFAYPEATDRETEIHLISPEEDQSTLQKEASYIAQVISKMCKEGYPVRDESGTLRPCKPGDFAILLRSHKDQLYLFALWLREYGLEGWTESTSGYFSSREVSLMLNLLKVIDNPFQDIPLLSVMLSPVFAFSADEVAAIRAFDRKLPLYLSLQKDPSEKTKDFLEQLSVYRQQAAVMSVEALIQKIYDETMVLALFGAMESSQQKVANLRLLLHYAKSYEQNSRQGLGGFLRYIEQVQKNRNDFPAANLYGENVDAVKIMTIHKSKGLEFPIVFIAGCSGKFHKRELSKTLLISTYYGITAKHAIPNQLTRYATLPYRAACLHEEGKLLEEEMRILYVAMTRAREKLFCVICEADPLKHLLKLAADLRQDPPASLSVNRANSFADWLFLAFFSHPDAAEIWKLAGTDMPLKEEQNGLPMRFIYQGQETVMQAQPDLPLRGTVNPGLRDDLEKRLQYKYPYSHLAEVPVKLSVTQILQSRNLPKTSFQLRKPLLRLQGLSAAQRGTANHLFFQFADFQRARENLQEEIARLLQMEFITSKQADALDQEGLLSFLHSSLLERVLSACKVEREFSFFYEMPAEKLYPQAKGECILVQGIADCVFWEPDGMVLLDYKTDLLPAQKIIDRYASQLQIYQTALEATLGEKVKERLIYSLHLRETLNL